MKYTVTINEKSKTVIVNLNGYEGVAKCCATDTFNLQTGIELALERARVAEENAKKAKPTEKPSIAEAKAVLEEYVGDHIAIIGKGKTLSENQKKELRRWADTLVPLPSCECKCKCDEGDYYTDEEIDDIIDEAYDKGYDKGYDEGYNDAYGEFDEQIVDENDVDLILEKVKDVLADVLDI